MGELRRALGDDGSHLIKTVPRRGYRFDGVVTDADALAPPVAAAPQSPERASSAGVFPSKIGSWWPIAFAILCLAIAIGGAGLALWMGSSSERPGVVRLLDTAKPSVAVLPFVNQGKDTARDYFVDGLTQDLISALGRFSALTAMSWNAVLPYKGSPARPDEIARSLGIRYQLEGNVLRSGDRVRVSAQLVNEQGQVLWSARFDEPLSDIFALQDRIAGQIASILAVRLTQIEQRRAHDKPTANLEAYDYVLRARPALLHPERAANADARALLRRAIELDPGYAAAYAALGETFYNAAAMGWAQSPAAFFEQAQALANKALALIRATCKSCFRIRRPNARTRSHSR